MFMSENSVIGSELLKPEALTEAVVTFDDASFPPLPVMFLHLSRTFSGPTRMTKTMKAKRQTIATLPMTIPAISPPSNDCEDVSAVDRATKLSATHSIKCQREKK